MLKRSLVLLAAVALLAAACQKPPAVAPAPKPVGAGAALRLDHSAEPASYRIDVTPDLQKLSFHGSAQIAFDAKTPISTLTLNAVELDIVRASLDGGPPGKVALDAKAQTASFDFGAAISPGRHVLAVDYTGKINTFSAGLFVLDYPTPQGSRRMMVSQFENADARRFVPSWDDPARKATFQISIVAPADQMAVSNTPIASTQPLAGGLQRVTFQPTPKMSSYLMFLGVGDFQRISRKVDGVDVGVVFRRGAADKARFALDTASALLSYYNDYFGIRYPLPKLDLIAAPGAGGFSAMENWGAIFYFEDALLVDPKLSTESDRQQVAIVIAHEMSHQWFGDLVTMDWWNDLWLNESFAEWMEGKAVDHLHPDWRIRMTEAALRNNAMVLDAASATHPIVQPVDTIDEMNAIGDDITYNKGAAVIRMLEAYVGDDAWRDGVRAYLHQHAYGNTTHDDLWRAIEAASHKPVQAIARDFTEQAGVPLVQAEIMVGQQPGSALLLTEQRFAADEASRVPRLWRIPVIAKPLGGGAEVQTVVRGGGPLIQALKSTDPGPLVLNPGQVGYYRTLYSPSAFGPLATRLGELDPFDQLNLIQDSWALADAGYAPAGDLLQIAERLPANAYPLVWGQLAQTLDQIDRLYDGLGPRQDAFRAFARKVLNRGLARIGWDQRPGEPAAAGVAREQLLVTLSDLDDRAVTAEARRRFARFRADPASLPPGLREPVLDVVGAHADATTIEALEQLARSTKDAQAQQQYLVALATVQDPALAQQVMAYALTPEVPVSLASYLLGVIADRHPALAWRFGVEHKAELDARADTGLRLLLIPDLLYSASDPVLADELHAFALKAFEPGGRHEADKVEARVRHRAEVRSQRLSEIDRWLAAHG